MFMSRENPFQGNVRMSLVSAAFPVKDLSQSFLVILRSSIGFFRRENGIVNYLLSELALEWDSPR